MANKMLIDASHPEETRVVVVRGSKVEEFDYESANRRQLRGNIYLAKVTRVEPSLQAAFVEYGGNRHGFLAFSEIHPDYYQIPVADRQALIEDEAKAERERESEEEKRSKRRSRSRKAKGDESTSEDASDENEEGGEDEDNVEQLGGDALEEMPERSRAPRRQYKIQEVIKRRQILLVQVVKEERGTKGAALTTYLSLAGRYSVLMPNTARGGGISRKITSADDRKRLKTIAQDLEVPEGMGVILRTAGASRTKVEIKRDFEYLMRAWESVREQTLTSTAPSLVYEEGSLIKRAIRDLYNKDIDEVIVAGDDGYREAKDFMRMLMPSHAKAVKAYKDPTPLFAAFGVEAQLDAMFSNQVSLKSGGYLVINPTEALVSIDVNSGRSTREHNIEDTALKTNLEAADEVARQLRLRDLAGLIVIDFIDMEEKRNNRAVEKRLKDALKTDRARIQIGRISSFGLLEMSRQRMRTGVLESSSVICPTCAGSGFVRATPSVALSLVRGIEETLLKGATHNLDVRTHFAVAFYVLNQKRVHLRELEERFGVTITIVVDETLESATAYAIDKGEPAVGTPARATGVKAEAVRTIEIEESEAEVEAEAEAEEAEEPEEKPEREEREASGDGRKRRRRRRRRGRGNGEAREGWEAGDRREDEGRDDDTDEGEETEEAQGVEAAAPEREESAEGEARRDGRRRRGRRGGRRDRRDVLPGGDEAEGAEADAEEASEAPVAVTEPAVTEPAFAAAVAAEETVSAATVAEEAPAAPEVAEAPAEEKPKKARAPRKRRPRKGEAEAEAVAEPAAEAPVAEAPARADGAVEAAPAEDEARTEPVTVVLTPPDPNRPKRAGWWSKAKSVLSGGED
ncbi:Rne/Rng family ribonuclease [Salinarimonas rosea]|uniref:Rne/Rng family ribonuclease n=1 Tax=Salinarimonas rosea TaxID=552063 RepID=UPI0003F4D1F0|nr:ribonuclease E/G [Salinarimonas rosea]